jgi:hypothetical protein
MNHVDIEYSPEQLMKLTGMSKTTLVTTLIKVDNHYSSLDDSGKYGQIHIREFDAPIIDKPDDEYTQEECHRILYYATSWAIDDTFMTYWIQYCNENFQIKLAQVLEVFQKQCQDSLKFMIEQL